jgi:predicted nucleic acid-binding protein
LRTCQIRGVDEPVCREAAWLRTATGRASKISAVDAVVAAFAGTRTDPVVLTSDPRDLGALAEYVARPITIVKT